MSFSPEGTPAMNHRNMEQAEALANSSRIQPSSLIVSAEALSEQFGIDREWLNNFNVPQSPSEIQSFQDSLEVDPCKDFKPDECSVGMQKVPELHGKSGWQACFFDYTITLNPWTALEGEVPIWLYGEEFCEDGKLREDWVLPGPFGDAEGELQTAQDEMPAEGEGSVGDGDGDGEKDKFLDTEETRQFNGMVKELAEKAQESQSGTGGGADEDVRRDTSASREGIIAEIDTMIKNLKADRNSVYVFGGAGILIVLLGGAWAVIKKWG